MRQNAKCLINLTQNTKIVKKEFTNKGSNIVSGILPCMPKITAKRESYIKNR